MKLNVVTLTLKIQNVINQHLTVSEVSMENIFLFSSETAKEIAST